MFDNSFAWWLFNLGVSLVWIAGSVVNGNYFLAAGGFIWLAVTTLIELPGTSSEEGSADTPDRGHHLIPPVRIYDDAGKPKS